MFSDATVSESYAREVLAAFLKPGFSQEFRELGRAVGYKTLGRLLATISEEEIAEECQAEVTADRSTVAATDADAAEQEYERECERERLAALVEVHKADPHTQYIRYVRRGVFDTERITEYVATGTLRTGRRERRESYTWERFDEACDELGESYDQFADRCRLAERRQREIAAMRRALRG